MRSCPLASALLIAALFVPLAAPSASANDCAPSPISTIGAFGSGQGQFNNPLSVCALPTGEVAVVDFWNSRVQLFDASGAFLSEWGAGELIAAVDSDPLGRLFVLTLSGRVLRTSPYGIVETSWLPPLRDGYYQGRDLCVHGNEVYVAANGNTVTRFTLDGAYLGDIAAKTGINGIAVASNGDLFATNENDHDVCRYTTSGALVGCWGSQGSGPQQFDHPRGMSVTPDGHLLVADDYNDRVSVWTETGQFVCTWGTSGTGAGQLQFPADIALGPDGEYYVAELGNDRVQKFGNLPTPAIRRSWGQVKSLYR